MSANTEQRKLAAIMFTDMVGYSALSQRNEALALELLEEHRRVVRGLLPRHGGREVKTTGDGFLLEFPSALAAVQGAVEIQNALHERNQVSPPERQLRIRIGIHVGDVVMRDGDIHGDGVNIAARIEPLAAAGGICISSAVQEQVRNKLAQPMAALGPAELKNIELPVVVHRVVMPWEAQSSSRREEALVKGRGRKGEGRPGSQSLVTSAATKWGGIAALLLLAAGAGWWFVHQYGPATKQGSSSPNAPISTAGPPPSAVSPGAAELARVRARLIPDRWQKEDFDAVSPMLDRLIQSNPEESDAWALRSIINSLQVLRNFDPGTKPLEAGKAAAERARRIAPESPLAELALGMHLVAMISRGGDPQACRTHIDRAVAALPRDALTRYAELVSVWLGYDTEGTERVAKTWLAAEPSASFPAWILAQMYVTKRQPGDVETWAEQAAADLNITGTRALYTLFESKYYLRADVAAARAALQRVPAGGRAVHRVVHARWLLAMAENRWDEALQELAQVPEPLLFDRTYHGPRSLLAGLAHQRAGRPDAAANQFREAERMLREQLVTDPDNEELHAVLAVTLACAGRAADARSELALVEPLVKGRASSVYRGPLVVTIAQAYGALGDFANLAQWLRQLFSEPNGFPFTPTSFRFDPRFAGTSDAPEIQGLLREFASLDKRPGSASAVGADPKTIAVLAFANFGGDKENEYFSDGITEELLNVLAKVPGLRVAARTSAFYFKDKHMPIPEIAQKLNVAYVVEGSVQKSGTRVKITAQLIKAADGFHVWSDTFTRELKDVFAMQDEIAGLIAKNLQLTLGDVPRATKTVNPEAHRLVLEGRFFWNQRNDVAFERAEAAYQRALELDPEFAEAHAGLADVWAIRGWYRIMAGNAVQAEPDFERAKEEVRRAQALNPALAEPYATLGVVLLNESKFDESERQFAQAITLNPNYAVARHWHSTLLDPVGRLDEGLKEIERSVSLDPLSPNALWQKAISLRTAGRGREALDAAERALALRPVHPTIQSERALDLWNLGRRDEAIAAARAVGRDLTAQPRWFADPNAIYVLRQAGLQSEAEAYAERALANVPKDDYRYGTTLVALGRGKEALTYLRTLPPSALANVYWHQMWDSLREDAQFQQWLVKLGRVEEYKVARETLTRMLKEREAKK